MDSRRNIRVWYFVSFFSLSAFLLPIWVVFNTEELGFSNTQAFLVGVLPYGLSAAFEIPSGAWSDRYGRAKVYRIGGVLYTLSVASFLVVSNFWLLMFLQLFGAVGLAMQSGGPEGLVRNSITNDRKIAEADVDAIYGKAHSKKVALYFVSRVIAVIGGAYLYGVNPRLPFLASSLSNLIGLACSFGFVEKRGRQEASTSWSHIATTLTALKKVSYLKKFFFAIFLYTFLSEGLFASYQPYFQSINVKVTNFGYFYALVSGASAAGALYAGRIIQKRKPLAVVAIMFVCCAATAGMFLLELPIVSFLALPVASFSVGILPTVSSVVVQSNVDQANQSTAVSISAFVQSIALLAVVISVGILLDIAAARVLNIVLLVLLCLGGATVALLAKNTRRELASSSNDE